MKTGIYCLWALLGVFATFTSFAFLKREPTQRVVLVKYKPKIKGATDAIGLVDTKIWPLQTISTGQSSIVEQINKKSAAKAYLVTFENDEARNAYLKIFNKEFSESPSRPLVESVSVIDLPNR